MNANVAAEKSDLEYQYSEDQLTEEHGSEAMVEVEPELPAEKTSSRFSRKKIITGIIICTMVGAIFQFLNSRDKAAEQGTQIEVEETAKAIKKEQAAAALKPVQQKTESKLVIPPQPVVASENKPVVSMAEPSHLERELEKVIPAEPATTKKYEPEIAKLQSGLQEVNQSVSGLQDTLVSLTASVKALSNQVEQLGKEQKAKPAPAVVAAKPEVKVEYYLKSLIAGRAWVESSTGELTTVKVGDELPGYGTITAIDPEETLVKTSSGTAIKNAPNDS